MANENEKMVNGFDHGNDYDRYGWLLNGFGLRRITLPVEVYNDTGVDIYELYASVVETNDWEEDILGSNILPAGSTFTINFTFPADKTRWDFKIVDAAGTSLEFYDLDFANCSITGATLLLEYDGSNGYATLN